MYSIYLKIYTGSRSCLCSIETAITFFLIKYVDAPIIVHLVPEPLPDDIQTFTIKSIPFFAHIYPPSELPDSTAICELPIIMESGDDSTIAGLCAILRRIIKLKVDKDPNHPCQQLLGFKSSCLLACSEASVWTKFCEVDIVSTLQTYSSTSRVLPESLARFERHLAQPVRLHNLYKYTNSKKFASDSAISRDESGNPDHAFAEGSTMTLSDLIIFVCVYQLVNELLPAGVLELFPHTNRWYKRMMENEAIVRTLDLLFVKSDRWRSESIYSYIVPEVENKSLYRSDQKRYKPRNKIYTRQEEVDNSLELIQKKDLKTDVSSNPFASDEVIKREKIPYEATPEGGALPSARLERKFQQLENLCRPVLKLAKPGDVIVDFCSGSGHLGILIACLLPKCEVILLENKEESLKIAKERVRKLGLKNVRCCQSNLDYFKGHFDIGTSLHACGVASDLVIRHCIKKGAIFVCCPCCYGSIQDCYHISYPRSAIFREFMDKRSYLVLGHAADQTHDVNNAKTNQGYECMAAIDTDRKLHAMQHGYEVHLAKLAPPTCTPKNNLLVGVPASRRFDEKN